MKQTTAISLLGLLALPLSAELIVHEWGTFTQVFGSDGTVLDGLEREEEALPPFVYGHAGLENGGQSNPTEKISGFDMPAHISFNVLRKGLSRPILGVNTKMETPVIYFYSDSSLEAQVKVGWNGGTISQWYPQRSNGDTPPQIDYPSFISAQNQTEATQIFTKGGGIDFRKGYHGSITWDVKVSPSGKYDQADLFKGTENIAWLHPRIPNTSLLTSGSESESYLFYRGLGRLDSGLSFAIDSNNTLSISNDLAHKIPFLMVFQNKATQVSSFTISNGIEANGSLTVSDTELVEHGENWKSTIYRQMRDGLVRAGLFPDEAEAMIQTWWHSYFATPSFGNSPRVFWVMPTDQVNDILPLSVAPQPDQITRVLVGRAEILTPSAESSLLARKDDQSYSPSFSRFYKSYNQRIQQLKSQVQTSEKSDL